VLLRHVDFPIVSLDEMDLWQGPDRKTENTLVIQREGT
jgi:hypothetical protein